MTLTDAIQMISDDPIGSLIQIPATILVIFVPTYGIYRLTKFVMNRHEKKMMKLDNTN